MYSKLDVQTYEHSEFGCPVTLHSLFFFGGGRRIFLGDVAKTGCVGLQLQMDSYAWLSTERALGFLILELLAGKGLLVILSSGLVYILGELAFLSSGLVYILGELAFLKS